MKAILISILIFLPLALRAHGTKTLATDSVETATCATWRYDEAYRHVVLSPVVPYSADVSGNRRSISGGSMLKLSDSI